MPYPALRLSPSTITVRGEALAALAVDAHASDNAVNNTN
jgi:hypothetical protein